MGLLCHGLQWKQWRFRTFKINLIFLIKCNWFNFTHVCLLRDADHQRLRRGASLQVLAPQPEQPQSDYFETIFPGSFLGGVLWILGCAQESTLPLIFIHHSNFCVLQKFRHTVILWVDPCSTLDRALIIQPASSKLFTRSPGWRFDKSKLFHPETVFVVCN